MRRVVSKDCLKTVPTECSLRIYKKRIISIDSQFHANNCWCRLSYKEGRFTFVLKVGKNNAVADFQTKYVDVIFVANFIWIDSRSGRNLINFEIKIMFSAFTSTFHSQRNSKIANVKTKWNAIEFLYKKIELFSAK